MSSSKYCYPGTNVLINKFDIRDLDDLSSIEFKYTSLRLIQLKNKPLDSSFDLNYLKEIHKFIFQDVYAWAGELRDVAIGKGNIFCLPQHILSESDRVFGGLSKENYLKNLNIDRFSDRLAYYSGEINALHPFREGNGRTTRAFVRLLAEDAGYDINFSKMGTEEVFNAFVASFLDCTSLKELYKNHIIQDIKDKYSFSKDTKLPEGILDKLHELKMLTKNKNYVSLEKIKAINNVLDKGMIKSNPMYQVVSDISTGLNINSNHGKKTIQNKIHNDFEL